MVITKTAKILSYVILALIIGTPVYAAYRWITHNPTTAGMSKLEVKAYESEFVRCVQDDHEQLATTMRSNILGEYRQDIITQAHRAMCDKRARELASKWRNIQ